MHRATTMYAHGLFSGERHAGARANAGTHLTHAVQGLHRANAGTTALIIHMANFMLHCGVHETEATRII